MKNKRTTKKHSKNEIGETILSLIETLYPFPRSLTGNGVRDTLRHIKKHIPITVNEIKTDTKALDWSVPKEWNIKDAYIKDPSGRKVVDFKKSNIHVVGYSTPIRKKISLPELKKHLHTIPEHPTWIPYLTSYYKKYWGFCLSHNTYKKLKGGTYEVCINSTLKDGLLTYGELYIPGTRKKEFLLSTYVCHPSICNDNLSGPALLTYIAKHMVKEKQRSYSYRFLFIPETIGAIVWLAKNRKNLQNIENGLVATCVGDSGISTYKRSREGILTIDRAVEKALLDSGTKHRVVDFYPTGSDERQFCSPGFNLPVGSLMRTPYDEYPEYHTSADNLSFMSAPHLEDSFNKYMDVIFIIENNAVYKNLKSHGEPQLGKYGVYRSLGGQKGETNKQAMFWILNFSDGKHSLLDIAIKSTLSFRSIKEVADTLEKVDLIKRLI